MNKVIPKFNKMSEEDKKELIKILTDYKPALEDALEDLENALTTDDNEQLLEVIDTLQHDFAHGNLCASWYQEHLEKLTPISNKYYSEEYSKEQDRIHTKMMKESEETEEAEREEAELSDVNPATGTC
jgi:hypothetical protein|tara:strand:- start:231 stop:614 length:384 start_codon:yes stop_codon:yes gene_type:complete